MNTPQVTGRTQFDQSERPAISPSQRPVRAVGNERKLVATKALSAEKERTDDTGTHFINNFHRSCHSSCTYDVRTSRCLNFKSPRTRPASVLCAVGGARTGSSDNSQRALSSQWHYAYTPDHHALRARHPVSCKGGGQRAN